jgi:hypothetical protein
MNETVVATEAREQSTNSQEASKPTNLGLSAVADNNPRFMCELVLWALCLRNTAIKKRFYGVGDFPSGLISTVEALGVEFRSAQHLISSSPQTTKLYPFLDEDGYADQIVIDLDLFVVKDISCFFRRDVIRLPPNNHAVPPLSVFREIFSRLGETDEIEPGIALFHGRDGNRETFASNVSAGAIFVPEGLRDFVHLWFEKAKWLSANREILGRFVGHIDQVSFAVAKQRAKVPFLFLPPQANAVLHLLPHISELYAIHLTPGHIPAFPKLFSRDKTINLEEVNANIRDTLARFNEAVREAVSILKTIPETRAFLHNFLNPEWKRQPANSVTPTLGNALP